METKYLSFAGLKHLFYTKVLKQINLKVDKTNGDISDTKIRTLETIETKFPIPAAGESTKVFLGKVLTFLKNIKPLEADVTYYVATTGSDTTGDGTSSKPFKTIQHVIDMLPKDLGGYSATVKVSDGTYNEAISMRGFINGTFLIVRSANQEELNTNCNIYKIQGINVHARIYISGINVITDDSNAFSFINCSNVIIISSQAIVPNSNNGFSLDRCNIRLEKCRISNYEHGIHATYNSQCFSYGWTNSLANTFGIVAINGAIVCCVGNQPSGNIMNRYAYNGGVIFNENGTQVSEIISSGISCPWGIIRGGYFRNGNPGGAAIVTINLNLATTAALTAGTQYTISGLPKALDSNDIAVFCAETYFEHAWFTADGNIKVIPKTNVPSNTVVLLSATYLANG